MTVTANTETVTVKVNGKNVQVKLEDTTALITALLAGRKAGYDARRTAKSAERAAAKTERDAKKAKRIETATAKKADKVAALEAKLAALKTQAA